MYIPIEQIILFLPLVIAVWVLSVLYMGYRARPNNDDGKEVIRLLEEASERYETARSNFRLRQSRREVEVAQILKRKEDLLDQNDRLKQEILKLRTKIADMEGS